MFLANNTSTGHYVFFAGMAQKFVDNKVAENKVMVFSKAYCPFCKMAKDVLNETGVNYGLEEIDERGIIGLLYSCHCLINSYASL